MDLEEILKSTAEELDVLDSEFTRLDYSSRAFYKSLNEMLKNQQDCFKEIKHQKYRLSQIKEQLKRYKSYVQSNDELMKIFKRIEQKNTHVKEIEDTLPKSNGPYLNLVLGSINVNLLDRRLQFDYKEQYERFKLWVTSVLLITSFVNIFADVRVLDSILHFMLVWYHCTLTIRESILVVNGSRIKGWWRIIHFLLSITTGVMVVWPDGVSYKKFRMKFLIYICYTSFLQFLQYYYQYGCLYRLRALGERYSMDITMQGFHSWMWKGLSFLLPFLFIGYCLQAYICYTLYHVYMYDPNCTEWQVPVVAFMYFTISLGNLFTTFLVVYQKFKNKNFIQPIRQMTRKISRAVLTKEQ